ncbi:hypothetical protein A2W14_00375 [Candidatus Gottesmanbacteria bacterium RBG_16_37_8]|uniref:Uncharacterized protein n=1 Tax=Candidatus Gottesmanbacteria bacterium RBG_16_37_8 TaxID=1798371 RepID=A0A1F5YSU1_9BACT|nr:MAG: hypothetical protein A2W14_00375 [Candidatus Gottesmanbacteria bacterium RBG_16_37_8]
MNKFILLTLGVILIFAGIMAGLTLKPKNQDYTSLNPKPACVDFDPPNTSNTVIFNGIQYDLIKENAEVIEESKFSEMQKVGDYNGQGLYIMASSDYFGQKSSQDLIFKLKNVALKSPYVFDIYLKDGVAIPDYIRNCKSTGGQVIITQGDESVFPPYSFAASEIPGFSDPQIKSFIYNASNIPFETVKNLTNVVLMGSVSTNKGPLPFYFHMDTGYLIDANTAYTYLPSPNEVPKISKTDQSLQIKRVIPITTRSYSWWTPSCKPAIYLYPTETKKVNVKVNTKGKFTLTIPEYKKEGWTVTANPSGIIKTESGSYPYLYYESIIPNSLISSPESGYVVGMTELPRLFKTLLPKLGLNAVESKEFEDYWESVLPKENYYFVAPMTMSQIDSIEPLEFSPKPDTLIRVRLYFEGLKEKKLVKEPTIITPKREGFTAVEWGGMLKVDKNSTFVCSQ